MQLTSVFTHTASEVVFKLLSEIVLQIDTSLKKTKKKQLVNRESVPWKNGKKAKPLSAQ